MDLQMAVERSGIKMFLMKNANVFTKNDGYELELRKNNLYSVYRAEHIPELCNKE